MIYWKFDISQRPSAIFIHCTPFAYALISIQRDAAGAEDFV